MPKTRTKNRPSDGPARPHLPPLEALHAEHQQVMGTLAELATLIERLDREGVDAESRRLARDVCEFFTTHARAHHAAEERHIFPGLLKGGDATLVEHVIRLQQDHGWLEEDWLEIEPQLQAVAEGYTWYDIDILRQALPIFEQLYRDHIALEESLVYPEAKRQQDIAAAAAAERLAADTGAA